MDTDLGAGYVSDDSFKFGDYTGLNDNGVFLVGDVSADYWGTSGDRWQLAGRNLGLESRSINVNGGRQGRYELRFSYDKIPHNLFESGRTPYMNPGTADLTLPDNWLPAATSAEMTNLDAALHPVGVRTERESFGLGFSFVQNKRLEYDVDYRYSSKEGTGIYGGSFLNTSTILPRPVDYATQTFEAGLTYRADSWSARFGYLGSLFSNESSRLRWDNPFTPVVPGANEGQAALEPDNGFHQFSLSGHYRLLSHTQLSGSLAVGRMSQDDTLLPFTINPNLLSPLPVRSLDAEVDTRHIDLRVASRPIRNLRLRASYTVAERDNKTPSLQWSYIIADALPAASRANLPYGYERNKINLDADYRLPYGLKISGGWKRNVNKRDFTEVDRSEEDEFWGKLKARVGQRADLSVKYAFAARDISDYRPVPVTLPPQNPLLRKYNLTDRERQGVELSLALRPTDSMDFSLAAEFMQDDYDESVLGLVSADYETVYADAGFMLPGNISLTAHAGYEQYESALRGSQSFSVPDWRADNEDKTVFAGLLIDLPQWIDRLDLQFGYTFSETTGEVQTTASGMRDAFPDLASALHRVELNVDYRWRRNLAFRFGWIFEDYTVDDWSLDGVGVSTLPRLIGLGNQWLDYDVNVVMLSFRYNADESE